MHRPLHCCELRCDVPQLCKSASEVKRQQLSSLRRHETFGGAREERYPEPILQLLEADAERRLSNSEIARDRPHAGQLGQARDVCEPASIG